MDIFKLSMLRVQSVKFVGERINKTKTLQQKIEGILLDLDTN